MVTAQAGCVKGLAAEANRKVGDAEGERPVCMLSECEE